ncbi:MAG: DUF1217 domain-containing protein [Hyphomicrobiaceae bacterium]
MISTYLSYHMVAADLQKSIRLKAADPQTAREAQYYQDNIGTVKTVDEFLSNSRLYTYAMKAYGLDDMLQSQAFMRKVLESDLTSGDSFANKLADPRFATFAKVFNFTTGGAVAAASVQAQEASDQALTEKLYSEQSIRTSITAAADVDYYRSRIATIQSVDDLLADERLTSFVLKIFDINPAHASMAAIKDVLTSDLGDPDSAANTMGAKYQALAAAFSFGTEETLPPGEPAQTTDQIDQLIFSFFDKIENRATPAAAKFRGEQYISSLPDIASVDDLLNDDRTYSYVLTAFGLDPTLEWKSDIREVLLSDTSDPDSLANSSLAYRSLRDAFNFNADGSVDATVGLQTADQQQQTMDLYLEHFDDKAVKNDELAATFYEGLIGKVKTTSDFVNTPAIFNYALKAFDLDPTKESKALIMRVLSSDPNDAASYVNTLRDKRYKALAEAFNFASNGAAQGAHSAQLEDSVSRTITLHGSLAGDSTQAKEQETADARYYYQTIGSIGTVDELLKDRKLVEFMVEAYGFKSGEVSDSVLKRALTSDPFDMTSFVNTTSDRRLRDLAAAFNFGTDGKAMQVPLSSAQDRDNILQTFDGYLRQSIETTEGESNVGVRLALYFQRMAPTITSSYSILADKALFEVVRTALGLPDTMANIDIDKQAAMIEDKLKLDDLKDPAKLDRFIARFGALYDLNNDQTPDPILALFQSG